MERGIEQDLTGTLLEKKVLVLSGKFALQMYRPKTCLIPPKFKPAFHSLIIDKYQWGLHIKCVQWYRPIPVFDYTQKDIAGTLDFLWASINDSS